MVTTATELAKISSTRQKLQYPAGKSSATAATRQGRPFTQRRKHDIQMICEGPLLRHHALDRFRARRITDS